MMRAIANGGARRAENASPARTGLMLGTRQRGFLQFAALALLSFLLASCATPKDVQHHVVISVKDQKLALLDHEKLVAIYPVSTSKYGLGDWRGSYCTPVGGMEIAQKDGGGMPPGTVFQDPLPTRGNVLPKSSRRQSVGSRILLLRWRNPRKEK